ncbi:hypothetical protein OGAPHI_006628 [Ogataea philodendri]|uniref:Arf-GAP domain-containing protein n=1 Tax=Ogataea philodendri TaxID=1378263 RepID=A0A9P8T126_9ASCO|nr:uncharacterized protein OGAPHI_006628 [Ogataea philodendri]KAH3661221.1 hypothetical protein OGAPHI_006628 [Ogataea philodendri]
MPKRSEQEQRLLEMLNARGNHNRCGECGASYPTWASWNLGVFLCGRCASIHRTFGPDISQVKSLSLDNWSSQELDMLESLGNKENHRLWNNRKEPFPYDDDDKDAITLFLRDKYIRGKFRTTPIDPSDYNLRSESRRHRRRGHSVGSVNSGHSGYSAYSGGSGYKNSRGTSPRRRRYVDLSRKLKYDYGFEDEERNLDALERTHGDVRRAANLLEKETREEAPPPLPRRKSASGALLDATKTGANDFDWLSGDQPVQQAVAQPGVSDVQIYQYVDPNTGQVYYIDSNGQQYIDPSQAEAEAQMQMQMQMQQMQQMQMAQQRQVANAQVMSMYNQPTGQPGQGFY